MSDVRFMVVSPPCIEPVNRAVYRVLAQQHGLAVKLVIPRRSFIGARWKECPAVTGEPFETVLLEVEGKHPRLRQLQGLEQLIQTWRPTHVLVDGDPGTRMTLQVTRAARALGADRPQVWVLTAENLLPTYRWDFLTALKQGRPTPAVGALITWWLRSAVAPKVDHVFTLSRDGTRVMEAQGFVGRATQIPLGFDPALFHPQSPEKIAATRARLGLRSRTVAYFGRLMPEKGLHLLLAALEPLKDLSWQLLLDRFSDYDNPEYTAKLKEQLAARGLNERLVFFDAKHAEMPDYMNAADVVVLPSISTPKWKEQYGRVLPEAMACGKIVVGSDSGAIPELIGEGGLIFPEGNVAALSATLRGLMQAKEAELASMRERAQQRADTLTIFKQAEIWANLATGQNTIRQMSERKQMAENSQNS